MDITLASLHVRVLGSRKGVQVGLKAEFLLNWPMIYAAVFLSYLLWMNAIPLIYHLSEKMILNDLALR